MTIPIREGNEDMLNSYNPKKKVRIIRREGKGGMEVILRAKRLR
jgi:hypothetical protein